jgi:carboxyl-terminal processing protease
MVASLNEKYTAYLDPKQKQDRDNRWQAIQPVSMNSIEDRILYIKLNHFQNDKVVSTMATCLLTAKKYSSSVILDLRDNPGGNFLSGLAVASQMIPTGLLVKTKKRVDGQVISSSIVLAENFQTEESRDQYPSHPFFAQVQPRTALVLPSDMPLFVLVNERTASAAELVAGALKFSGRATLVGVKTFGKGVGMSNVNLAENQALQTTSFEFFPAGKNINGIGVSPQVTIQNGPTGDNQLYEAIQLLKKAIREQSL